MNELALQAAIAELENQRNFFQLRCVQMAQEIARLVKELADAKKPQQAGE